jgi:hypothetical protein
MTVIVHSRIGERAAKGHATREQVPLSGHADWVRAAGRADPIGLLEALEGV